MGMELLDLVFRIERRFGIRIGRDDLSELLRKYEPPDITVGELFDYVRSRADYPGVVDGEMDADSIWLMFQRDISTAVGLDPDEITKERWLIQDLIG